ncbi:RNA polymerase sigma factor [Pseudobythopirellula maris]|uniref:RNA polymerase sigma factor n=1 Tax=Pseudobythopirellula maris TaxID=2527991 RepID=A0A5C5ZX31_9BACT|nr:sigma-70 family RNA polymerase sigma factor [Pseudobythopirellula maris]TWT90873.1 RNA polymerase sigma factor [Pseudobythopirellula maris]
MNAPPPDTRMSLILRLGDADDEEAWRHFAELYEPVVYRLARSHGMQDADAREVVQEVLLSVSRAVERWTPDPERGRFRTWLGRITRNELINRLTRRKHQALGSGDSGVARWLGELADPATEATAEFDLEWRREAFRWAAERVRERVSPTNWRAFWMTSVEARTTDEAATTLGVSPGAVHVARSRVRARLRVEVRRLLEEEETLDPASEAKP